MRMVKTTDLVTALRCCASDELDECRRFPALTFGDCFSWIKRASADKIEELVDRCARYAEEIAVMQEKQRWVDAKERQPEYGVSVLAVASGKAANITLCDAIVFATFWDGWELDDYPQAENVTVKWWRHMAESPEGGDGECEV